MHLNIYMQQMYKADIFRTKNLGGGGWLIGSQLICICNFQLSKNNKSNTVRILKVMCTLHLLS